jgi:hypothetical protein
VNLAICDSSNNIVATLKDSLAVPANSDTTLVLAGNLPNPQLSSLGCPYLYRFYAELWVDGSVRDMIVQRTGFRSYTLSANSFAINGVQKLLRGAGLHAENEAANNTLDSLAIRRQFEVARDMGMNYLRLVHSRMHRRPIPSPTSGASAYRPRTVYTRMEVRASARQSIWQSEEDSVRSNQKMQRPD